MVFKDIENPKKITKGVKIPEMPIIMRIMITLGDYVVEVEGERSWFQIGEGFEAQIAWKTMCQWICYWCDVIVVVAVDVETFSFSNGDGWEDVTSEMLLILLISMLIGCVWWWIDVVTKGQSPDKENYCIKEFFVDVMDVFDAVAVVVVDVENECYLGSGTR